ncbi:hypothetical protein PO909_032088, partial [Leuciscus waleckii]
KRRRRTAAKANIRNEKQTKWRNILKRGSKAVKRHIQTRKTKVYPFVAEQESQVHPETSSVEPPAGTDALESEPTDRPFEMEQTPDTNPVAHETMMCLPGQVCEDLCVPGPSKIKKTQHADPVDPELPPVPDPSSCDLDDKKQTKWRNILKRGSKAVKRHIQTRKTKVYPFVAEQESQVHPETSSVEPPAGTDALESEPTDRPFEMEQTLDTNPVAHETMMCLPGLVCEDLCVPGPSKIKKTQHADPVDPELPPVPDPSNCDLDDTSPLRCFSQKIEELVYAGTELPLSSAASPQISTKKRQAPQPPKPACQISTKKRQAPQPLKPACQISSKKRQAPQPPKPACQISTKTRQALQPPKPARQARPPLPPGRALRPLPQRQGPHPPPSA